jgi:hypothetical protein
LTSQNVSQLEPGKSVKVRCTTAFSDAGNTLRSKWEQSSDAANGPWNDVSIVELATCTVADRAKIGESLWQRCTGR